MITSGSRPEIQRGITESIKFIVKNADGTAKNLTGATVHVTFAHGRDGDLISHQSGSSVATISNPSSGEIIVKMSAFDTRDLPEGELYREITLIETNGDVMMLLAETVLVTNSFMADYL